MIVVDTNIIGYLHLTSEHSQQVERLYQKDPMWAAPLLWRSEFRNVLAHYIRKQILTLSEASRIMESATRLMLGREYEIPSPRILELAAGSSCSAYDCEFVALADQLNTQLLTVDRKILQQFPQLAFSLGEYLE